MSKRKRTPDPPPTNEAPAYMGQYASLMTILLAFFIIMLTLGQDRVAQYKTGVGMIRNLTGFNGGTGVLDFWRAMRTPPAPRVKDDASDDNAKLIGFQFGARDSYSFTTEDLQKIEFQDPRKTLRIRSGIRFSPGRITIKRQSQFELDQVSALLYSLKEHRFVVEVRVETGEPEEDRQLAARRATWLMRHLIQNGHIPYDQIRSSGLCNRLDDEDADDYTEVIFLIRRMER